MASCSKKVYKTMCEKPNGDRTGHTKYNKVRYSSRPKKSRGKKR